MTINIYNKLKTLIIICIVFFTKNSHAQSLVKTMEAETGSLSGLNIASQTSNSSGSYVTGFDANTDKLTMTVNFSTAALYKIVITYRANQGEKTQLLSVNNSSNTSVVFPASTNFTTVDLGYYWFNAGNNTITITSSWGYFDIDLFSFYSYVPHIYTDISSSPIDPNATQEAKDLYTYIKCQVNNTIISGQTNQYFDSLVTLANQTPLLRAFDFQSYTQGYSYNWKNNGFAFGANPSGATEDAIKWYNTTTNKKGIVSFQWHWHSPTGGSVGTNTFYTQYTSFDANQAIISGTSQNADILEDIDAVAVELKKLAAAKVPVIFRPLHEAGGAWFWWGAKGSTTCKKLWDIVYNRIVNYHGIHNLIWAWSTPESDWYLGNDKLDIFGYDSYPGAYDYTVQKNTFDQMYTICSGKKIIALTENGPIPDINKCFSMDAPWAFYCSWDNLVAKQNTTSHIKEAFANSKVLTLAKPGSTCTVTEISDNSDVETNMFVYKSNQFWKMVSSHTCNYKIYTIEGSLVQSGTFETEKDLSFLSSKGIYTVLLNDERILKTFKIIVE